MSVTKEVKSKKVKVVVPPVVEVAAPVVAVPDVEEPVVEDETEKISFELEAKKIIETLDSFQKELKGLKTAVKNALSLYQKESRDLSKKNKKKNRKPSNGQPHGFAKSALLSNDLCDLLSMPHNSELPSPKVTSLIAEYVRKNELYVEGINNKSVFRCDAKLLKVLGKPKYLAKKTDESLGVNHSFWNLQTTMKDNGHFIRPEPTVTV